MGAQLFEVEVEISGFAGDTGLSVIGNAASLPALVAIENNYELGGDGTVLAGLSFQFSGQQAGAVLAQMSVFEESVGYHLIIRGGDSINFQKSDGSATWLSIVDAGFGPWFEFFAAKSIYDSSRTMNPAYSYQWDAILMQASTATFPDGTYSTSENHLISVERTTLTMGSGTVTVADACLIKLGEDPLAGAHAVITRGYALWSVGHIRSDKQVAIGGGGAAVSGLAPTGMSATVTRWEDKYIGSQRVLSPCFDYAP